MDGVCIGLRTLGARPPGTEFSLRWLLDSAGSFGTQSDVTLIETNRAPGTVAIRWLRVQAERPERPPHDGGVFTKGWIGVQSHKRKERLRSNPNRGPRHTTVDTYSEKSAVARDHVMSEKNEASGFARRKSVQKPLDNTSSFRDRDSHPAEYAVTRRTQRQGGVSCGTLRV